VLTTLFTITAYAVYQRSIHLKVPKTPEELTFQVVSDLEDENARLVSITFQDLAMVIHFDTEPDAHDVVIRDSWLPEEAANSDRLGRISYYDDLDFFKDHIRYVGWEQRPLEELLAEAGFSAEEAKNWYSRIYVENPGPKPLLNIEAFDGAALYARDVILGWPPKAAGSVVREDQLGPYQLLEVQIDCSAYYKERFDSDEDHSDLILQNHLFLFEPEQLFVLHIAGSACAYPFETLEQIGENLQVRITAMETHQHEAQTSYLFCDLGRG